MIAEGHTRFITFEGKQDLEKQLERRVCGYRVPQAKFVVLRDKDAWDCRTIKNGVAAKCATAGKPLTLVRIACHEIESWYLADLAAVEAGLQVHGFASLQNKKLFSHPDDFPAPSETLLKLVPTNQKIDKWR